jgi:sugar phosphate isomerase/epimerase
MTHLQTTRRELLAGTVAAALGASVTPRAASAAQSEPDKACPAKPKFRLGLVTYNLAFDWDVPTIIKRCKATGFEGVELRTTHKHGVEPTIDAARCREVRKQFEDGGVRLWGLGSTCEFQSPDPAVVEQNIEMCKQFCKLAKDVGAAGVKVRPNGLPRGVPVQKTLEQIGKALRRCGEAAESNGVEIWCEVHGGGTSDPPNMRTIMDHCGHPKVGLTWNSNGSDVKNGSVREYFSLLRPNIKSCHINELTSHYPWRELLTLFRETNYDRFTLAEVQAMKSKDAGDIERFMRFYRALWLELCRPA